MAAIAQDNSLGSLASLLSSIGNLAGSTTTSSTNVSAAGQQALLENILGSTNGLAQVASGQKTAGLYNSTVNTQMINDLLARSTAQVAAENKTTTQTTKNNLTSGSNLTKIALALGGKTLLSKGGDYLKQLLQSGTDTAGGGASAVASALSGGTVSAPAAADTALLSQLAGGDASGLTSSILANAQLNNSVLNGVSGSSGSSDLGLGATFTTDGADIATGATTSAGQAIAGLGGGTLSSAYNAGDNGLSTLLGSGYSSILDEGGSSVASSAADAAASDVASSAVGSAAGDLASAVPYIGTAIGVGTKAASGDSLGAIGTGVGAAVGSIFPGIGTALGSAVGGFVGSNIGTVDDWKSSLTDTDAMVLGVPGLGNLSDKLVGAVESPSTLPGLSSVLGGMGGFGNVIGDIIDGPGSLISSAIGGIGDIFSSIGSFFGGLF